MNIDMTPVSCCLHKVNHLSAGRGGTVAGRVDAALDELERAYRKPSERIVALDTVLQEVSHDLRKSGTPLGWFVQISVERRQERLARHA